MAPPRDNSAQDRLLAELQGAFTDALLQGDEHAAELVLREALDARVAESDLDEAVIAPALRVVGDLWAQGAISVAEEHLATEIALRVVALQRDMFRVVRRRSGLVVVVAAVEGEHHVVALRMAGSLLAHVGYDVKQLGANVPHVALGIIVARHRPAVVALGATMPVTASALEETVRLVQGAGPGTGLLVGGQGVPAPLVERPGLRFGARVSEIVPVVDSLAQRASMN